MMENHLIFAELVTALAEDYSLLKNPKKFADSLGLPYANFVKLLTSYDKGDIHPYDFIRDILLEWIYYLGESATVKNLRRILRESKHNFCSEKLLKFEETHPGPIKIHAVSKAHISIRDTATCSDLNNDLFEKVVTVLSLDEYLLRNKLFVDCLGISIWLADSIVQGYKLGDITPYDAMVKILSGWIQKEGDSATVSNLRESLQKAQYKHCSDKLKELEETEPIILHLPTTLSERDAYTLRKATKPIFGAPPIINNFTGREDELNKLNEYFHSSECRIVLLSGLAGIGKTELANKFAMRLADSTGNSSIIKTWLSGENPQSLLNSLNKLCQHVGVSATDAQGKPHDIDSILGNLLQKISEDFSSWLVVIDDVYDIHKEFVNVVKTLSGFRTVFILMISIRRDIFAAEVNILQLSELKLEESISYMKKCLEITDNFPNDYVHVCLQLGNFPLALAQAVGYIKQMKVLSLQGELYGVREYLAELACQETVGLDTVDELSSYPVASTNVWHITFGKIQKHHDVEGKMALELLDAMAFINADEIQLNSLTKLFSRFYNTASSNLMQIESCIRILFLHSLVSVHDGVIIIHRLVRLSLRILLKSTPSNAEPTITKNIEMLKSFWTSFDEHEWSKSEMVNIVVSIWHRSGTELNFYKAAKLFPIFNQLERLGMVNEPLQFAIDGCKFLHQLYGPDNKYYLLMERNLAIAQQQGGQFESGLQKLNHVYSQLQRYCGNDDKETLRTGRLISSVLYRLRRYEESLEWSKRVLQSYISIYGENHEYTMSTKQYVALTLQKLEKTEAFEILNEVLMWQEANLGKQNLKTIATRHNIAICFYEAMKYKEACSIFEDILILREQKLGAEHPSTLETKEMLAVTLSAMGEISKALSMLEEVMVLKEKVLSAELPHIISVREKVEILRSKLSGKDARNASKPKTNNLETLQTSAETLQNLPEREATIDNIADFTPGLSSVVELPIDLQLGYESDSGYSTDHSSADSMETSARKTTGQGRTISINKLVDILVNDAILLPKMKLLIKALKLDIPEPLWKAWSDQLASNDATVAGVIRNVLKIWRAQKAEFATFSALVDEVVYLDIGCTTEKIYNHIAMGLSIDWEEGLVGFETPVVFGVGNSVPNFIGRRGELSRIKSLYQDETTLGIALSGFKGIGKTQLVRKFITELLETDHKTLVIAWLDGQNNDTFTESLKQLCLTLFIPVVDDEANEKLSYKDMLTALMQKILQSASINFRLVKRPCLLVIDHFNEATTKFYEAIHKHIYLPVVFPIIISRQKDILLEKRFEQIELKGLEIDDSKTYLINELELTNSSANELTKMCVNLRNFPLWLQQAVVYINIQKQISWEGEDYGVAEYLREFEEDNTIGLTDRLPLHEYGGIVLSIPQDTF